MGGMFGAYGVRLLYGEVCLTCNKKVNMIPSYQFLTPNQIKDVISGRVNASDVKPPSQFVNPGEAPASHRSGTEELREYKGLLDDGIITQEEFEALKKRILNL
jgi:hypothetical protein